MFQNKIVVITGIAQGGLTPRGVTLAVVTPPSTP